MATLALGPLPQVQRGVIDCPWAIPGRDHESWGRTCPWIHVTAGARSSLPAGGLGSREPLFWRRLLAFGGGRWRLRGPWMQAGWTGRAHRPDGGHRAAPPLHRLRHLWRRMVGMQGPSDVAVSKDESPIFDLATYGIVGIVGSFCLS